MKSLFLVSVLLLMTNIVFPQTQANFEFISETKVLLNEIEINKSTTINDLKSILGEPKIYKSYNTGKVNYHFDDIGVSVHTFNDKLIFIGANFNWDGDKTFPATSFLGTLKIDGILIDKNSGNEIINRFKNLEFIAVIPDYYISKPKTEKKITFVTIGFKENAVTQTGFEFH